MAGGAWVGRPTPEELANDASRFDAYGDGGMSAAVKSAPRASFGLTEGNLPSRASRGQAMLSVGSFQRMERSPAGW